MSGFDARAFIKAVLIGAHAAAVVFIVSIAADFPRVWPGTVGSFVMTTCSSYLFLTPKSRARR
jgi:hypothetical protein